MNISEVFIKKPVMTVLIALTLILAGVATYLELPVSDLPTVDSPVITVDVSYPGASPETMATNVAQPLENEFAQIQGLKTIISNNTLGSTQILLTFDLNRTVDEVAPDVQAAISNAQGNLPSDLPSPPSYSKQNPSDKPIFYLLLRSTTLSPGALYDTANKMISQRLTMIEGVSNVQIYGAKRSVRVQVDPALLAKFETGLDEVANALNKGSVIIPGGSLNGKYHTLLINPDGQLLTAPEYDNLIIKYQNGAPIRVRDVGRAVESLNNDVLHSNYGAKFLPSIEDGAIVLAVSRAAGTNTVKLSKTINATLAEISKEIGGTTQLFSLYDRAVTIEASINDVKKTLWEAFLLVALVIFLFLGRLSDTVVPCVTMPLSILSTFPIMYLAGFSLDNLSLMALTVSIGFIVDDAIVVLENTVRLIEEGMKPMEAAIESAKMITGTIMSMTLSLMIVFVPLVFMGGTVGRTFREFAIVVIVVIFCSGIISLTLTPMMCARMLKPARAANEKNIIQKITDFLMSLLIRTYSSTLKITLRYKFLTIIAWGLCLWGTVECYNRVPHGFLPIGDSSVLIGALLTPLGSSTEEIQKYQKDVNKLFAADPNVEYFFTVTGINPGADQSMGFVVLKLYDKEKRKALIPMVPPGTPVPKIPANAPPPGIQDVNRAMTGKFFMTMPYPLGMVFMQPMPTLEISTGGEGTDFGSTYSYSIRGQNAADVYAATFALQMAMYQMPELAQIQNTVKLNMPQLTIKINRDRASSFNLTAQDIGNSLANAFAQGKTTQYSTPLDQYWVTLELDKEYQREEFDLSKIYVKSSATGAMIPLDSIAEYKVEAGPQKIQRYQQQTCGTLSFNTLPGVPLGTVTDKINKAAAKVMKPGLTGAFQGQAEEFQRAVASLGILILIAIFLKYVVLGILYESYVHPLTVLSSLPVGIVGGLFTLLITGAELTLYAWVGLFMLIGIVAKNGIMMIDFANQLLDESHGKMSSEEAIFKACQIRFRPILMTGIAAIMGAIPIALGWGSDGESRQPLGFVVVGGIAFSQIVTLYVTPGIYLYLEKFQEKVLDRFELTRSDAARHLLADKETEQA